jgi:hypothetical protein
MLELLIAVALAIALACVSTPALRLFDRLIVRIELDNIYTQCMLLRQQARMTGVAQELIFDPLTHAYSAAGQHYKLPRMVRFGILNQVKGPPSVHHSFVTKPITFPKNKIIFYPDGIMQAGTVYLCDRAQQFLCALTIAVSPISYIRRYTYSSAHGWTTLL